MTREKARSSQTRETTERAQTEYVFEEPTLTNIPDAVKEKFNNSGITLGWLRIEVKGNEDYQNIGKKQQQGWEIYTQAMKNAELETSIYLGGSCKDQLSRFKQEQPRHSLTLDQNVFGEWLKDDKPFTRIQMILDLNAFGFHSNQELMFIDCLIASP